MSKDNDDLFASDEKLVSPYIKSDEFQGDGLILRVVKKEIVDKEKFGADMDSIFVKQGLLEEGQAFKFTLSDPETGAEREFETTSAPFYRAMNAVNPKAGDLVLIKREGDGPKTKYFITKK